MVKCIDYGKTAKTMLKYALAALIVWFLASKGAHPAWGIILIIYRKAAFKLLIAFALFYWLTSSII